MKLRKAEDTEISGELIGHLSLLQIFSGQRSFFTGNYKDTYKRSEELNSKNVWFHFFIAMFEQNYLEIVLSVYTDFYPIGSVKLVLFKVNKKTFHTKVLRNKEMSVCMNFTWSY